MYEGLCRARHRCRSRNSSSFFSGIRESLCSCRFKCTHVLLHLKFSFFSVMLNYLWVGIYWRCKMMYNQMMNIVSVYCCERKRDKGLFQHSSPRSSHWVQTAWLLCWLGLGPPGSQRKVPFLAPLKLNCGHRPCNLETQLLIYQHRNYIRYFLSPHRPYEKLRCEVGKPLGR